MRKLGEGAEAKIFETEMFGERVVAKVRQEKKYRIRELDVSLRASRTRREARLMHKAHAAGVEVPRVVALGKFSIYMEKLGGRLMKDCRMRQSDYGRIGRLLAAMHNAGIIHGDFTPANLMVRGGKISVIDFGLAEESGSAEERAIDLLLMKRSIPLGRYEGLEMAYAKEAGKSRETLRRLAEVELRGRYQIRTLV
jgi:TP53 regulating kinase-like protein